MMQCNPCTRERIVCLQWEPERCLENPLACPAGGGKQMPHMSGRSWFRPGILVRTLKSSFLIRRPELWQGNFGLVCQYSRRSIAYPTKTKPKTTAATAATTTAMMTTTTTTTRTRRTTTTIRTMIKPISTAATTTTHHSQGRQSGWWPRRRRAKSWWSRWCSCRRP